MTIINLTIFTIILSFLKLNEAIIGYDCGNPNSNISVISMLDAGECNLDMEKINSSTVYIELLQVAEFRNIHIKQCKIEISRTVFYCGYWDYLLPASNGQQQYIFEISREACDILHNSGIFKYGPTHVLAGNLVNKTTVAGVTFAGKEKQKSCIGKSYSDFFGSWENVYVQGTIKITLTEYYAQVNLREDKIRLSSGTSCKFSDTKCMDMIGGHTFWNRFPYSDCFNDNYDILYKGVATKMYTNENNIIYTLNTSDILFALTAKDKISFCNRLIISTEEPKLFIYEALDNKYFYNNDVKKDKPIQNLNIFSYVNSKFVYVERHIKLQMKELYYNIMKSKCELERKTIQNSLTLSTLYPDGIGYLLMDQPGYFGKIAGEVIYLIKCIPIEVKILHTEKCFQELPVQKGNETLFLTAKTHILTNKGNEINCNKIMPNLYKIGEEWIKMVPTPTESKSPKILKPNTDLTWSYISAGNLAASGIYPEKDLEELQDHIMFAVEKPAILNNFARGLTGNPTYTETGILNYFTSTSENITNFLWEKFKEKYWEFSIYSAGIIMIIILTHLCIEIFNAILRAHTLHSIFGWSIYLLGAVFSSVTHLLILLNKRAQDRQKEQNVELQEIVVNNDMNRKRNLDISDLIPPPIRIPITTCTTSKCF